MGAPVKPHAFEDNHRAGKRCHPGNLGSDDLPGSFAITVGGASIWLDRIAVAALACWPWQVGERHAPRNARRGCGLPPDRRRHATIERLYGFGRVSGTGRSRPPPRGPDLARPGSRRLRRRSPARLSAHAIDGVRGLRVHQAGPLVRHRGRRASRPLRLQPLEPGPRGVHRPSGAGRLGRAKPGHAVLHLGRRYHRPDHPRPRAQGGRPRGQGSAPRRRSLLQGQRFGHRRPRCPPQCRDPSVQLADQPGLVRS